MSLPSVKRKYNDRIAISRLPLSVQLKMKKLKLKMMNPIIAEIYLKALEKGIINSIVNQQNLCGLDITCLLGQRKNRRSVQ